MSNDTTNYKDTLNLLSTSFPMRADASKTDYDVQDRWEKIDLSSILNKRDKNKKKFVLHDGPPYANGNIHLGHAYNKTLKDIMSRFYRMVGFSSHVTPGWDCHGLPIERAMLKENPITINKADFKKVCRNYANDWIEKQKADFKKLGIAFDWNNPYKTMDYRYEADIIRAFADLVEKGYAVRKNKTIPWCPECQTALASSEIEYQQKKDPSVYILFKINKDSAEKLFNKKNISLLVWTTTSWTLPLNRAVMLKTDGDYGLFEYEKGYIIIGLNCKNYIEGTTSTNLTLIQSFKSSFLADILIHHPLEVDRLVRVVFDNSVLETEGTACVHTAPGCGPLDYEVGVKNGLEIYSPIDDKGCYTNQICCIELTGMKYSDGSIWVIKKLHENGMLFFKNSINHSFPHCWRSKTPLIFRATTQYFIDLSKHDLQKKALKEIEKMEFYPKNGSEFLKATIGNRWEWCISRQRSWGSPIISLLSKKSDQAIMDPCFMRKIADYIEKEGIEYWDNVSMDDLYSLGLINEDIKNNYYKEDDILDVWFDSGSSNYAVLKSEGDFPASVYLEGIDQHRGWFQSSLLISIALNDKASMQKIVTHGFTVDAQGRKMSKSLGNVLTPFEVTAKIGTDGLRLWASSLSLEGDAVVSDNVLANITDLYRKIRNTCRFLLTNISDFDKKDILEYSKLNVYDQLAIKKSYQTYISCLYFYYNDNYPMVLNQLSEFCSSFLSTHYFDSLKDTLYCDRKNKARRKSAQSSLSVILEMLNKLIAPIMVHTSELVYDYIKADPNNDNDSIHLKSLEIPYFKTFQVANLDISDKEQVTDMYQTMIASKNKGDLLDHLFDFKHLVMKEVEVLRNQKICNQSLEVCAQLEIGTEDTILSNLIKNRSNQTLVDFLQEFLLISKVILFERYEKETVIKVSKHSGKKCPRCWKYHKQEEDLCHRCFIIFNN